MIEVEPRLERQAYTPAEFCRLHGMTKAALYKLWLEGRGPRVIRLGNEPKAKILIPVEAAEEWRVTWLTNHTVDAA